MLADRFDQVFLIPKLLSISLMPVIATSKELLATYPDSLFGRKKKVIKGTALAANSVIGKEGYLLIVDDPKLALQIRTRSGSAFTIAHALDEVIEGTYHVSQLPKSQSEVGVFQARIAAYEQDAIDATQEMANRLDAIEQTLNRIVSDMLKQNEMIEGLVASMRH